MIGRGIALLCRLICLLFCAQAMAGSVLSAPSVFQPKEADLSRYSAILATSEPFRQQCSSDLKSNLGIARRLTGALRGRDVFELASSLRKDRPELENTLNRFEQRMEVVLRSYDMTPSKFNKISETIRAMPNIKQKVRLQAYLYKIRADFEGSVGRSLPSSAANESPNQASEHAPRSSSEKEVSENSPERTERRFAEALREIEGVRLRLRQNIKMEVKAEKLPADMANPETLPAMATAVQQACAQFPVLAERIVAEHGFTSQEFSKLRARVKSNWWYRRSVNKELGAMGSSATSTAVTSP